MTTVFLNRKRTGHGYIALLIFIVLFLSVPSGAFAALRDIGLFVPKIYYMRADMEINAGADIQKGSSDNRSSTTKDIFALEKIRLHVIGFVYHPRFMQYSLNVGVGLRQEKYSSDFRDEPFRSGFAKDYDIKLLILPDHPYTLELYARHGESLPRLTAGIAQSSYFDSLGAIFILKNRSKQGSYFFTARAVKDTVTYDTETTSVTTYAADGDVRREFGQARYIAAKAGFQHLEGDSFFGTTSSSNSYQLSNDIGYGNYGLASSVYYQNADQSTASSKAVAWTEILSAQLPWNFDASFRQDLEKDTLKSEGTGHGEMDESTSTTKKWEFHLHHKLYKSLTSAFDMYYQTNDSSADKVDSRTTGTNDVLYYSLSSNYSKIIPYGQLMSGIGISKSISKNNGTSSVINEAHTAVDVPGSFVIESHEVEIGSIEVRLKSPLAPFEYIELVENVHYTVTLLGGNAQITVYSLPAPFLVPGTYDFYVSYDFLPQNNESELTTFNYNLRFKLFEEKLIPYYNLVIQKQKVISGILQPNDSTTHTLGLIYNRLPYQVRTEYSINDSNEPYQTWKAEVMYARPLQPTLNVHATAHYAYTSYGETVDGAAPTSQSIAGGNFSLTKRFPSQEIYLTLGGGYTRSWGQGTSQSLSLNSEVQWFVGKAVFRLGANSLYSSFDNSGRTTTESTNYFYLNVKRNLF